MRRLRFLPLLALVVLLLMVGTLATDGTDESPTEEETAEDSTEEEPKENIVASGECGDNVTYTLNSDGLLTISGTGPTYDYLYIHPSDNWFLMIPTSPFWQNNGTHPVQTVQVEEGVTTLGNQFFNSCWGLRTAWLPKSITSIGSAFYRTNLQMIFYAGSENQFYDIDFHNISSDDPILKAYLFCLGSDETLTPGETSTASSEYEKYTVTLDYTDRNLTAGTPYRVWYVFYNEQGQTVSINVKDVTFEDTFQTDVTLSGYDAGMKCRFFLLDSETFAPAVAASQLEWT